MVLDPVSIGLGVASLATGIMGSRSAKKSAKKASRRQAALTYEQRQEEIRQLRLTSAAEKSLATAATYASNLQMRGTPNTYIKALDMENMREIAFAERAAELERKAIKAGAAGAGDALLYQGVGDFIKYGVQGIDWGGIGGRGGGGTTVGGINTSGWSAAETK